MSRLVWLVAAAGVAVIGSCTPRTAAPGAGPVVGAVTTEPADNFLCLVCHINYQKEPLAQRHQLAGIGCGRCHGRSDAHRADEDGITPPEVLFARADVDRSCQACHPARRTDAAPGHLKLGPLASADKTCTDCHGQHRLTVRTRRWDSRTGWLVADDGVRMIERDSPPSVPTSRGDWP